MNNLTIDTIYAILEYINIKDIKTISRLSSCNKYLLSICRDTRVLNHFYNTLLPQKYNIKYTDKHYGPHTFYRCGVGPYPGWNKVNNEIKRTNKLYCVNNKHYKVSTIEKTLYKKNPFKQLTKKYYEIKSKQIPRWTPTKEIKLLELKNEEMKIKLDIIFYEKAYSIKPLYKYKTNIIKLTNCLVKLDIMSHQTKKQNIDNFHNSFKWIHEN